MIGTPAGLPGRTEQRPAATLPTALVLPLVAVGLVAVPVFLQAPLVRAAPLAAALCTVPLVATGVLLERYGQGEWQRLGPLLVGFSGSWLGGCLFWGWFRTHPLCHLPLEAFALPLALAGLGGRWRLAGAFYLASLLGTAATDAVMAAIGVMQFWPQVLQAPLAEAPALLQQAAEATLQPLPLLMILLSAGLLLVMALRLWQRGEVWRVSAAALATTVVVDGVFLASALASPLLSGVI